MKILIAYDGSSCSEAAIDDLLKAGLPAHGEARVVTVAEVWMPPNDGITSTITNERVEKLLANLRAKGEALVEEAKSKADAALARVRSVLPEWSVDSKQTYGSPAWEILSESESFGADLIVVGSHGQSAISRFFLGSISQKILSESKCSVRVSRGRVQTDPAMTRVMIGFDSTKGAQAAVASVIERNWPEGTEVRLVTVLQDIEPTLIGKFVPPIASAVTEMNAEAHEVVGELASTALDRLRSAGLNAEYHIESGNARSALVEHAESWDADSIFMGANAFAGLLDRVLIGSTSAAVAARAHCSVEVVRVQ